MADGMDIQVWFQGYFDWEQRLDDGIGYVSDAKLQGAGTLLALV